MTIIEIRERISKCIKESAYNQTEIAHRLEVKQQTVNDYVRMKSLPALDTLAKLCILLDIDANYILGIEDYSGKKNTL